MIGDNTDICLNDLLKLQAKFMSVLGIDTSSGSIVVSNTPSQTELGAAIGITVESAEILEIIEKAGRAWKMNKKPIADDIKEELIDVIFFCLELAVLLGMSGEDIARVYLSKYKKNLLRYLDATATSTGGVNGLLVNLMDEMFGYKETERLIKEAVEKRRE